MIAMSCISYGNVLITNNLSNKSEGIPCGEIVSVPLYLKKKKKKTKAIYFLKNHNCAAKKKKSVILPHFCHSSICCENDDWS